VVGLIINVEQRGVDAIPAPPNGRLIRMANLCPGSRLYPIRHKRDRLNRHRNTIGRPSQKLAHACRRTIPVRWNLKHTTYGDIL
jgi:hypothetical protein